MLAYSDTFLRSLSTKVMGNIASNLNDATDTTEFLPCMEMNSKE